MKITIAKSLIEREDEKAVVSRIPGRRPDGSDSYLSLSRKNIIAESDNGITAEIDPEKYYILSGQREDSEASVIRGENLLKRYHYEARFDKNTSIAESRSEGQETKKAATEEATETTTEAQPRQTEEVTAEEEEAAAEAAETRTQAANASYSGEQFRQLKLGQRHHVDVAQYWDINLSGEQMKELRLMLEADINVEQAGYNKGTSADMLSELRGFHQSGQTPPENWGVFKSEQLKEIRLGMEAGIDTRLYGWAAYSAEQMKQLRLGLEAGYDVAAYRNPHYSVHQMEVMRHRQIFEQIKEFLRDLWERFKEFFHLDNLSKIKSAVYDKVADYLGQEEAMYQKLTAKPEDTLNERIKEAIEDIKELLAAQELVPETVMTDQAISERMEARIREALDNLMQPEIIAEAAKQDAVIEEAAKETIRETGAELTQPINIKDLAQQLETEQWEELQTEYFRTHEADKYMQDYYQHEIYESMTDGKIDKELLREMKDNGFVAVQTLNGSWQVEAAPSSETEEGVAEVAKEAATVQGMTEAALDRAIEDALDEAELAQSAYRSFTR